MSDPHHEDVRIVSHIRVEQSSSPTQIATSLSPMQETAAQKADAALEVGMNVKIPVKDSGDSKPGLIAVSIAPAPLAITHPAPQLPSLSSTAFCTTRRPAGCNGGGEVD